MTWSRRLSTLGAGLLSGLLAAAAMILWMSAARTWLGVSPPPEAVPDRLAPTLTINQFFSLFAQFGGYNGLKKFGVTSGIAGMVAAATLVGVIYAVVVESRRSRAGFWRNGFSLLGLRFVALVAAAIFIGSIVLLWPVLQANYLGLPPTPARVVGIAGLFVDYLIVAVVLVFTYRFITIHMLPAETSASPGEPVVVPAPSMRPAASTGSLGIVAGAGSPAREHAKPPTTPPADAAILPVGQPVGRRALIAAAAAALLAVPSWVLLRRLYEIATFPYDGTVYSGPGVQPITPNDKFYTVTKNVIDPRVDAGLWGLEIGGMVNNPRTLNFSDLTALPATKQETTLMCISNNVGAGLSSNTFWTGVPMRDLLNEAGVQAGAVEVMLFGADGYTDTFSIEKALEPTTMVVYQMNGEPLPQRHGFPARVVVPGLFGEKNVKWVTGISVIDYDGKGFYETQGWGPNFEVPTRSDIFAPKRTRHGGQDSFDQELRVYLPTVLKGRAFAGDRGVKAVELSLDGGKTWEQATIDYPGTKLTWVFWSYRWTPTKTGDYLLVCRAIDDNGDVQSDVVRGVAPEGATGYHKVKAKVV